MHSHIMQSVRVSYSFVDMVHQEFFSINAHLVLLPFVFIVISKTQPSTGAFILPKFSLLSKIKLAYHPLLRDKRTAVNFSPYSRCFSIEIEFKFHGSYR